MLPELRKHRGIREILFRYLTAFTKRHYFDFLRLRDVMTCSGGMKYTFPSLENGKNFNQCLSISSIYSLSQSCINNLFGLSDASFRYCE